VTERLVPVLYATDAAKSAGWYARLGFSVEGEHRFAPGLPFYLFLKRGDVSLHLSEHKGDARPGGLVYFYVDDITGFSAEFDVEIREQPWGTREIHLTDPDGNRIRVGQRVS